MQKERTIKELLQLMLDNKHLFERGLCYFKDSLYSDNLITFEEYFLLEDYIKNNKPKRTWYNFILKDSNYWWKVGWRLPRIIWLKYHISIN